MTAERHASTGPSGAGLSAAFDPAAPLARHPMDGLPLPAPPSSAEENLVGKLARREAKLLAEASRPLDPWERYRALDRHRKGWPVLRRRILRRDTESHLRRYRRSHLRDRQLAPASTSPGHCAAFLGRVAARRSLRIWDGLGVHADLNDIKPLSINALRIKGGGERGIRTLGRGVTPTRDFQSRRFNRSRISPHGPLPRGVPLTRGPPGRPGPVLAEGWDSNPKTRLHTSRTRPL
jgi:hypothetical protein